MKVVIVESPAKAKTIKNLNHIENIPKASGNRVQ